MNLPPADPEMQTWPWLLKSRFSSLYMCLYLYEFRRGWHVETVIRSVAFFQLPSDLGPPGQSP